jgi:hypothetical protein
MRSVASGELNPSGSGWTLSDPFDVQPTAKPGQQHVRFTFTAAGTGSEYQIYNFYVDPRFRR